MFKYQAKYTNQLINRTIIHKLLLFYVLNKSLIFSISKTHMQQKNQALFYRQIAKCPTTILQQ